MAIMPECGGLVLEMNVMATARAQMFSTIGLLGLVCAASGCTQPPPTCQVARLPFVARYDLISGTGPCAQLKGEIFGAHTYYYPSEKMQADFRAARVALTPDLVGSYDSLYHAALTAHEHWLKDNTVGGYRDPQAVGSHKVCNPTMPQPIDCCPVPYDPEKCKVEELACDTAPRDMPPGAPALPGTPPACYDKCETANDCGSGWACRTSLTNPMEKRCVRPYEPLPVAPNFITPHYSIGDFVTAEPESNGFCQVPELSPVEVDFRVPLAQGLMGPHVKYEWSELQVLVTPAYTGNQWSAILTYTRDGCSATYDVWAVAIDVDKYKKLSHFEYTADPESVMRLAETRAETRKNARCTTVQDCAKGWQLNPEFNLECMLGFSLADELVPDQTTGVCALAAPPPSLVGF
ncbi:MAG: hypothetical protein MJD61_04210 [Proteobacteria bacterium]|nr:hypothetical protein [Pseudomonadota bacterium]